MLCVAVLVLYSFLIMIMPKLKLFCTIKMHVPLGWNVLHNFMWQRRENKKRRIKNCVFVKLFFRVLSSFLFHFSSIQKRVKRGNFVLEMTVFFYLLKDKMNEKKIILLFAVFIEKWCSWMKIFVYFSSKYKTKMGVNLHTDQWINGWSNTCKSLEMV